MSAGMRRSRVNIEQKTRVKDDWGHENDAWVPYVEGLWVNIKHLSGRAFVAAGKEVSEAAVSIRISYRRGVTAAMRVRDGDTVYEIKAVLPDEERRRHVDLVCGSGARDG